jgi:hypothetical protein
MAKTCLNLIPNIQHGNQYMNMNYTKQKCKWNFILITYETMNMNMKRIRLWCKIIFHIGVEQFGGNK